MQPATLIPTPDAIPVHWAVPEILMLATFVVHILLMNAFFGTAMLSLAQTLWGRDDSPGLHAIAKLMPTSTALTVNAGVAPLLFMQVLYGHFFYLSDIMLAFWWFSVIGLVIVAYYGGYVWDFRFERLGRGGRTLVLAFLVAVLFLISFVFTNNFTLMLTPPRWLAYFANPGGTLLNLGEPTLFPRWLHFVTAALAVGGLTQAVLWTIKAKRGADPAYAAGRIQQGMKVFAGFTLLQGLVGSWFLLSLPDDVAARLLGGHGLSTGVFVLALAGAVLALVLGFRAKVWPTLAALVGTVVLMACMRELVRIGYLAPYFFPGDLPVRPQFSPVVLFLATLVVGVGVLTWVLRQAAKASATTADQTREEA
jgi:hypothetical protein